MKKVELEEKNIVAAFKIADPNTQTVLKALCPDVKFKKHINTYTDIEEFDDAYDMVEDSHTELGDTLIEEFNKLKAIFPEDNHFYRKAQAHIIVFAANGCDESFPNNNDDNQRKYYA